MGWRLDLRKLWSPPAVLALIAVGAAATTVLYPTLPFHVREVLVVVTLIATALSVAIVKRAAAGSG